jgi:hypothetical protein
VVLGSQETHVCPFPPCGGPQPLKIMASAPDLFLAIASFVFFLFMNYVADARLVYVEMPLCKRTKCR